MSKHNHRWNLAFVLGLSFLAVNAAVAQVVDFSDHSASSGEGSVQFANYANRLSEFEARLQAMENYQPRIASLESEVQRLPALTYQSRSFFYAGYDHVLAKPYFSRNVAFYEMATLTSNFTSFDWSTQYTPRFYVGYEADSGTGVRVAYWQFDGQAKFLRTQQPGERLFIEVNAADATVNNEVATAGATGSLVGGHSIQVDVLDLELTRNAEFAWGWLRGQGGVRYARLEQSALWLETGSPDFVALNYDFEGIGPTVMVEAGVPLFGSNLSAFANMRGSLLFGNRSITTRDLVGGDTIPSYDSLQSAIEGQVGLDWATTVFGHPLTVRAAMEAQTWFRGGAASGGDDEGIPVDQIDMGFFGAAFTTILEL